MSAEQRSLLVHEQTDQNRLGSLLALSLDAALVRVCLIEPVDGAHRLVAWINVQRAADIPPTDQVALACQRLGARIGRRLWKSDGSGPHIQSDDPIRLPPVDHVLAAASPRPRLRVWLAGLTTHISLSAALQAAAAAPASVMGITPFDAATDAAQVAEALLAAQPEVLVVVGGYDSSEPSTQAALRALCRVLAHALRRLPPTLFPLVLYAGSGPFAAEAEAELRSAGETLAVEVVENVHPTPQRIATAGVAQALDRRYWRLCLRMPGISSLAQWVTPPLQVTSLESNFIRFVGAWRQVQELPVLHGLYMGPGWRVHVWSERAQRTLHVRHMSLQGDPSSLDDWPPIELVCGPSLPGRPSERDVRWWDRSGLTPLLAGVGQLSPQTMVQVIDQDLLGG